MGQPTHCYDYDKLGEPKISLTNEISENKFKTLLDKDIELMALTWFFLTIIK